MGHTLEVASGGTYRAALHRVISHTEFDRLSVVLKLHLKDEVRLPGAETTAGDLLAKFKRDRPTVNPLPADGRVSAVGPVSFDKRRVDEEACPMHVCVFMQEYPMEFPDEQDRPFPRLTEPTILPLCGPLRHSMEYPVLCNPFYTLWVLKEWSRDADVELNEDVRRRIMQLGTWVPTTAADVIRAITTHVQAASGPNERPVTEGNVRLHLDPSNLIGINSKNVNKPLPELIPRGTTYPLKWSVVNGLSFLLIPLPTGLNETISVKIESQDGQSLFFKIKSTTVLRKLLRRVAFEMAAPFRHVGRQVLSALYVRRHANRPTTHGRMLWP